MLTGDNVGESYGLKTLFVQAVGSSGVFTNSGPINEGSSGTVFFSTVPFDPSPEDRAAPLKYSYDFDNDGTWDVGDGTYAGGVRASSVAIPASFNDGTVTRAVRGRVMDKDFAFDDDGDTLFNTDANQTADPGESNDNFSDYITNVVINNVAPTIALTGNASVNEGTLYTLNLGAITDPGTDSVVLYTIDWGDGSPIVESFPGNPANTTRTHIYPDGAASRTILVSLQDDDGMHANAGTLAVTVNNVAPTIVLSGSSSIVQGTSYVLTLGAALDPGQDTVSAYSINWGDGSPVENYTGLPNSAVKTHTYSSVSSNTITVSLTDEDGTYAVAGTKLLSVTALVPAVALSGNATTNEGALYTLNLGAVTNAGTVTSYSVDWGDGTLDSFLGSPANVNKTHTYADGAAAGTARTIAVSVTNGIGTFSAGTLGVTVNNVGPTILLTGTGTATVGVAYSLGLGAITDPGTDTITGYSINWGDSTIENFSGSPVGLTKTHTYSSAASVTVTVSLTDEDGTFTGGTQSVAVGGVATPPAGFGPTTYTGLEMNALVTGGGATAPSGTRALTGNRLDVTGTVPEGIVFQLPLFPAGTFTAADSVTFTTTVDWTMLSADNDFGIGITDGVKAIAGQEADNGKFWLEQGNFATDRLTSVAYPNNATLVRTVPITVTITVTPSGIKVRGTNAAGDTFQHTSTSTLNLANALSLVLLSNNVGEKYGINSLTVQAVKAGASLSGGQLLVNGTGADDTLLVRKSLDGTQVIVDSNFNGGPTVSSSFAIGSVTSVRMNLGTGDDKGFVRNNGSVWAMPSTVNGDDGNDLIVTAQGNDTLNGGRGKDFLIGGRGADTLEGNDQDNILVAGFTRPLNQSDTALTPTSLSGWLAGFGTTPVALRLRRAEARFHRGKLGGGGDIVRWRS